MSNTFCGESSPDVSIKGTKKMRCLKCSEGDEWQKQTGEDREGDGSF